MKAFAFLYMVLAIMTIIIIWGFPETYNLVTGVIVVVFVLISDSIAWKIVLSIFAGIIGAGGYVLFSDNNQPHQ